MDLQEQLKKLFPDHQPLPEEKSEPESISIQLQKEPLICKYEKRKGAATTLIEGYEGSEAELKILAKELKTFLGVGGSVKDHVIIVQGDYRDKIMQKLKEKGFKVKRVGG
ncbi:MULTISPECIES: translation initiation factor [Flavobacterium]|uniref:Translation initiation factor SUI1-related protein n=1 Tax=Flavobacterium aurantiibacter TaxID=2023067 RepID=A0A255ZQJ0_9FLAO|nr:translation initiation factor [Flavobacterium aurantiibacter]OYQ43827.1 translation initiation factor SUI1-related protein [Flavobacterium aurantiibacter]